MLVVSDLSQIEARTLAWAADDQAALKRFALYDSGDQVNGDPYAAMAAQIFGGTAADYVKGSPGEFPGRHVGKQAELGCGYQMGAERFHNKVIEDGGSWEDIREAAGVDLTAADVVRAWRSLHEDIVAFWYEVQRAAISATLGTGAMAGPYEWANVNGLVLCRLPSGRCISYHGMSATRDARGRHSLSYVGKKGKEHTYGGKLTENIIQATSRDIMALALAAAEREGLNPVLTVHDEIVTDPPGCTTEAEALDALACLDTLLTTNPPWATGLPLASEGFVSERYTK